MESVFTFAIHLALLPAITPLSERLRMHSLSVGNEQPEWLPELPQTFKRTTAYIRCSSLSSSFTFLRRGIAGLRWGAEWI